MRGKAPNGKIGIGVICILQLLTIPPSISEFDYETENDEDVGYCTEVFTPLCPPTTEEVYKEERPTLIYGKVVTLLKRKCCTPSTPAYRKAIQSAAGCQISPCMEPGTNFNSNLSLCSFVRKRWMWDQELKYEEAIRDTCAPRGANAGEVEAGIGTQALCCPTNSQEGMLTLLLGSEVHQFPHFALLEVAIGPSHRGHCGGTIYNQWYIITASHCFLREGKIYPEEGSKVYLDVRISGRSNLLNIYEVEEFIPHPNSTQWKVGGEATPYNDVGLVKLKKPIQFGKHIKALPIAQPGFDPFKYSNETVIIGTGRTDTHLASNMLQRAWTYLRDDKRSIEGRWRSVYSMEQADGLLFLGGMLDGQRSPRTGQGDSGGPAICRGENGLALLCGTDTAGPVMEYCQNYPHPEHCYPVAFMETQHFSRWIQSIAGDQSEAEVLRQPLFGAEVPEGQFEHQVHLVTSSSACGGTLIEKDVVVTAAHCVVEEDLKLKEGVQVLTGVRDLNQYDLGEEGDLSERTYYVTGYKVLPGFRWTNPAIRFNTSPFGHCRSKRIARMGVMPTPKDPYYKNDLALLKLDRKVKISQRKLPVIGPAPQFEGYTEDIEWTTEVSLPLPGTPMKGRLQQRDFRLFKHKTCEKRLNRGSYAGYRVKLDRNIICGEEKYNGGAQCDRELGGGLMCKGKEGGRDVLCGVQIFRFCQLALPSAFLDISQHKEWIQREMQNF